MEGTPGLGNEDLSKLVTSIWPPLLCWRGICGCGAEMLAEVMEAEVEVVVEAAKRWMRLCMDEEEPFNSSSKEPTSADGFIAGTAWSDAPLPALPDSG